MNENTFIGDFDIEYLLNRAGNVRLKAYNRYNDQNYYLKSATTTQGVGIVFRRDFDKIFNFLNTSKKNTQDNLNDSIAPSDSSKLEIQPIVIPERK
jgi:coproporphyrinogen III oxidase